MNDELKTIKNYIHAIEKALAAGDATDPLNPSYLNPPVDILRKDIDDFLEGRR